MSLKKARADNQQRQEQFRARVRKANGSFLSVVLDKASTSALARLCRVNGTTRRDAVQAALKVAAYGDRGRA